MNARVVDAETRPAMFVLDGALAALSPQAGRIARAIDAAVRPMAESQRAEFEVALARRLLQVAALSYFVVHVHGDDPEGPFPDEMTKIRDAIELLGGRYEGP